MVKLLKPAKEKKYTDLVISFLPSNGDEIDTEDLPAPPIRYFFNLSFLFLDCLPESSMSIKQSYDEISK